MDYAKWPVNVILLCEFCTAQWFGFLCAVRLLIWIPFNKGNTHGELKQPLLLFSIVPVVTQRFQK